MQEMPGVKFVEMGIILGGRWRLLPAEERKKYEDLAAEDKLRFSREMAQYNAAKVIVASPMDAPLPHDMYMASMEPMQQFDPNAYHYQYH